MHWKLFIVGVLLGSLAFQTLVSTAEQPDALPVPFVSQFDGSAYAATDCGPASLAMAINYATGEHLTPLEVRQALAKLPGAGYATNPASGTAIGDLGRIAHAHNVEVFAGDGASSTGWGPERIRKHLALGHPVIVLVRLALLPGYNPTSQFDHYILLTGATSKGYIYNDPGRGAGAHTTISESQLQAAQHASSVPGQGIALAGPKNSTQLAAPGSPTNVSITVARGDTLSEIAQRYGLPLKELATLNRVPNVDHIQVGQVLVVPAAHAGAQPAPTSSASAPRPTPSASSSLKSSAQ